MRLVTAAQMFKALADPTRLRILALLHHRGAMHGTALADALKVPRGRVARHLRYLYKAWLVTTRRDANETYYCLRKPEYPLHVLVRGKVIPRLNCLAQIEEDLKRVPSG